MIKWFDKSKNRYMINFSKYEDLQILLIIKVFHENLSPYDAVIDIVSNNDHLNVSETINTWNLILLKMLINTLYNF